MKSPVIAVSGLTKLYGREETEVRAVDQIDLQVDVGDYVAIMGASGSGKSTMMNIIGCLDAPTSGTYRLDGIDVATLPDRELSRIRNQKIGFVFQNFNLIARTSALENVELPLAYAGVGRRERRRRAVEALTRVGLEKRLTHTPAQLSGGQQQRVAIARAIVGSPVMLLADEPTGALDSTSTTEVLDLFDQLSSEGRTLVVITHEDEVADRAKRVLRMRDGRIDSDLRQAPLDGPPPRLSLRREAS
ncbi:MAG: ABC transporter [Actinobacteria bacterium HGW-Actinobacteria-2]|nr:MAG: ABC transporter [Actinobacteria bacterium HGW-Actinobacteria-2]